MHTTINAHLTNVILSVGLYLHIGYSMTDRYLIEHNSDVRFDRDSVTAKLAALLNSHSPEQVRARAVAS